MPQPLGSGADIVIAVDAGTTATKVVAFTPDGQVLASSEHGYPLHAPEPGYAEQDPDQMLGAALAALAEVVAAVDADRVAGLAFSSAMHTAMALDADGRPITALTSWADTRSEAQAARLHGTPEGLALHRRTGNPIHTQSVMVRLAWFAENDPDTRRRAARWCGIKEYLLLRLCGDLVMDHSTASGAGLMNLEALDWDTEALAVAQVRRDQLPRLVPATHVLQLADDAARRVGLRVGTPVVVGGGDGPLANLGVGAVRPGMAACSLGTSGALRVVVDRPAVDPGGQVFCYGLVPGLWVVGGAVTNGGLVMRWALESLAPDLGEGAEAELLALAEQAPPGSGGLLMAPYLLSERAPRWSSVGRGAYVGLTREHGRPHLVRAALEGVCLQLSLVLESMRAAGLEIESVRATGGVVRSRLWQQLLADTFALPIDLPEGQQGSGYGAAIIGMVALGMLGSVADAPSVSIASTVAPIPANAQTYARLRPLFGDIFTALTDTNTRLRDLGTPAS